MRLFCRHRRPLPPRSAAALVAAFLALASLARGRDPDPLEAIGSGDALAGMTLGMGGPRSPALAVRAGGRDLAPVEPGGSYRAEGLPVGLSFRLEAVAAGRASGSAGGAVLSDPILVPGSSPPGPMALDLKPPFGGVPPRRGIGLAGPGGASYLTFGTRALRSALQATVLGPGGAVHLDPLSPGVSLRSTHPLVAQVDSVGAVTSGSRGRAWAAVTADGEEAAVAIQVDTAIDSDGDGLPDSYEIDNALNPNDALDGARDTDLDGLSNLVEFLAGTNPRRADTDLDGVTDGTEVLDGKSDPLRLDTDGDGAGDAAERAAFTDPRNPNDHLGAAYVPVFRSFAALPALAISLDMDGSENAYILATNGRLYAYRIDPTLFNFSSRSSLGLTGTMASVAVDGARAYVAANAGGLHIVDISNPAALVLKSTLSLGTVAGVAAKEGVLYVTTDAGLSILEPTGVDQFRTAGFLPLPGAGRIALAIGLAFIGNYASNQLVSVDISNHAAPRILQRLSLTDGGSQSLSAIATSGTMVYVSQGTAGVIAVSARKPDDLRVLGSTDFDIPGANMNALAVRGDRLFAHDLRSGFRDSALIFRIEDDGKTVFLRTGPLGATGSLYFFLHQNYLLSLSSDTKVTLTQVLVASDHLGALPTGTLEVAGGNRLLAPGDQVSLEASIRDDVYIESVDFLVEGVLLARDTVPPFRTSYIVPADPPPPREILIEARGLELSGNLGPAAAVILSVDRDSDGDGIPDGLDPDREGDGLTDAEEEIPGSDGFVSDPARKDSDGDGIPDGEESTPGADGSISSPSALDGDGDLLPDPFEVTLAGTDPLRADSDGDGVPDGDEDPDGDGLSNALELAGGTNPRLADTDGDGVPDGIEVRLGLNPLAADTDGDGISDGDEDTDGDGLSNRSEVVRGTDPASADTDGDGVGDGDEVALGTDPRTPTDFEHSDVRISGVTFVLRGPFRVRSMELVQARLMAPAGPSAPIALDLTVSGLLKLDPGSRIDAVGRGFAGGSGSGSGEWRGLTAGGLPSGDLGTGGSHGGAGGLLDEGHAGSQPVHGRFADPRTAGGGGAARPGSGHGGAGGGIILISAGSIVLDGSIDAGGEGDGSPGYTAGAGAGAGGSIRVAAGSIRGAGVIRADGGKAASAGQDVPGGGGGGRISIRCDDLTGFDRGRIHARGGGLASGPPRPLSHGGAGTVFFLRSDRPLGRLVVENGGLLQSEPRTVLPSVGDGTIGSLTDGSLSRLEGAFPAAPYDLAGLRIDPDVSDDDPATFEVLGQVEATLFTEPGLLSKAAPGDRFRGVVLLDRLEVFAGGSLAASDGIRVEGPGGGPGGREFALEGGEIHAEELVLVAAPDLKLTDAVLSLERVAGASGRLGDLAAATSTLGLRGGLDCDSLSLDRSGFLTGGPVRAASFSMAQSVLTVNDPDSSAYHPLIVEVEGAFSVGAASLIDLVGKGYVGGYSGGNASASGETGGGGLAGGPLAGASHGGLGGHAGSIAAPGEVPSAFGDFRTPTEPGGGGSSNETDRAAGGNGGGLARISADELVLDGLIDAGGIGAERPDRFSTDRAGAGAGGSVLIDVRKLRGAGEVRADGGSALRGGSTPGGGGGGRIAVTAQDLVDFTGSFHARGGGLLPAPDRSESQGGAGTIHLIRPGDAAGDLAIDNGGRASPSGSTPLELPAAAQIALARLSVRGAAQVAASLPVLVSLADRGDPSRFSIAGSLTAPRLDLPPIGLLDLDLGRFDVADLRLSGPLSGLHLTDAVMVAWAPIACGEVSLVRSAITVPEPTSTRTYPLLLAVEGTLLVDSGSALDLRGLGYVGGWRGGNGSHFGVTVGNLIYTLASQRSGGSHGALGGYYGTGQAGSLVQPVYDSYQDPQFPGSGGYGTPDDEPTYPAGEPGFNGGGLVRVSAREVVLDGVIDAAGDGKEPGDQASFGGGGAGGGVFLQVETLRGSGEIDADGGSTHFDGSHGLGTGGGGRIAVYYSDMSGFPAGHIHAYGGAVIPAQSSETGPIAGAGTVFLKGSAQGYGDLILDNAGKIQANYLTQLRAVGAGKITLLTASTLKGDKPFPSADTKLIGQWVVVNKATSTPFRIAGNTSLVLTTRPEDGDMTLVGAVGNDYQGAIVLDNLTVRGSALFTTKRGTAGFDLIIIATGSAVITSPARVESPPIVHW